MNGRKLTRDRAKAALKDLKKQGRLPKNYPLAAFYKLFLLQEKGERLLAQTRARLNDREAILAAADGSAPDSSFDLNLLELHDDVTPAETTVQAEVIGE